jgi:hypothetical protein
MPAVGCRTFKSAYELLAEKLAAETARAEAAEAEAAMLRQQQAESADAAFEEAKQLWKAYRDSEAKAACRRGLARDPRHWQCMLLLGCVMKVDGDRDCLRVFVEAMSVAPFSSIDVLAAAGERVASQCGRSGGGGGSSRFGGGGNSRSVPTCRFSRF